MAQVAIEKKLSAAMRTRDAGRICKVKMQLERLVRERERAREVLRLHAITVHRG